MTYKPRGAYVWTNDRSLSAVASCSIFISYYNSNRAKIQQLNSKCNTFVTWHEWESVFL